MGNGTGGVVDLLLFTPGDETNYATLLSAEGTWQLANALVGAAGSIPKLPPVAPANVAGQMAGKPPKGPGTQTYFDQTYDTAVIQALGVLVIRVNLLDQKLIELSAAVSGLKLKQAHNQYYSTANMKAKLDSLRSILDVSELTEDIIRQIKSVLDFVKKVSDRRNDLIHGRWSYRSGKHRTVKYSPNSKVKEAEITVTEKLVLNLVEDYGIAHMRLMSAISSVAIHRNPS